MGEPAGDDTLAEAGKCANTQQRGVWITKSGKYVASISVGGKKRYLGVFATIEEASAAYARAAKKAFGAFATAR